MFQKIQQDDTASIGKELCSPSGLASLGERAADLAAVADEGGDHRRPVGPEPVTSTSYTPERPSRLRSVAVAVSTSPRWVGARKRISAPAATVRRS